MIRFLKYGVFAVLAGRGSYPLFIYIAHDPRVFGWHSVRGFLTEVGSPLLWTAGITLLAYSLGSLVQLKIASGKPHGFEEAATRFALGIGFWALALFTLGLFGLLNKGFVSWIFFILSLMSVYLFMLRKFTFQWFSLTRSTHTVGIEILKGILLYAFWHSFLQALAPPTDFDALTYHLAIPKLYATAGVIREIPWCAMAHWPHLMNVFYSLPLFLGHDTVAALLHLTAHVILLGVVFHIGRLWFNDSTAWVAIALLGAQPLLTLFSGVARVEGWWALFHFLAYVSAWKWKETSSWRWLISAGLMAGFAAATKLLGLAPLLILAGWILFQKEQGSFRTRVRLMALFLACGLSLAAPWYLMNWLWTGNPIWPFSPGIFGGKWGNADFVQDLVSIHRWSGHWDAYAIWRYFPQGLLIPLMVSAAWSAMRSRGKTPCPPFLRFLFITLLPYLLAASNTLGNIDAWRYLMPWLPALALATGWYLTQLFKSGRGSRLLGAALLGVGLLPVFALTEDRELFAALHLRSYQYPGREPRDAYLLSQLKPHRFYQQVNAYFDAHPSERAAAKVLLFPDSRGYYLDVPYQWGEPAYQGLIPYRRLADGAELGRRLAELRLTHLLICSDLGTGAQWGSYDAHTLSIIKEVMERQAIKILDDPPYALYALKRD